ncbi:TonB-dependent receptor [Luminiphilus sp.]|nr:TonB-dependent receptor [Luminiphilus sp.]
MQRISAYALLAVVVIPMTVAGSEETLLEEIIVTASFVGVNESSATRPIYVLDEETLEQNGVQTLGAHLDSLLGVAYADFGAAVGQPIIRGLSGNRVRVLNNGSVVRDVSALGPDHAVDVSLSDVQQVEVVRGPSALLYSNGSIGGIVNVVDNTIPKSDLDAFSGSVGAEAQSVNDGEAADVSLRGNLGGVNLTYSYQDVDMEDYEIPNGAVIGAHHDEDHEEGHDEDHEEGHEEDHDEGHEEDHGDEHGDKDTLANSDVSTTSHRFGVSTTGDWGYVGLSYSDLSSTYGIPFHSEAAHDEGGHDAHEDDHDDDHGDEYDEDHDADHDADEHGDEHEGERIFSKTESEIISLSGSFKTSLSFLNAIDFAVKQSDYELKEQHAEGEHGEAEHEEGHGHEEGPTVFSNEATEVSISLDLSSGDRIRRLVLNHAVEEISIIGEEAFMAPVDSTETTLGFFSSDDLGFATLDIGLRFDQIERDGFIAEMHHDEDHDEDHEGDHDEDHEGDHDEDHEGDHDEAMEYDPYSFSDEVFSAAATLRRDLNEHASLSLGLASVSKTPSAVELFMNGEHLASSRYEVGDVNLDTERSDNIDLAFTFDAHNWFGSAAVYYNRVDNYIYLRDELEEEHEAHGDEDHGDEHGDHGGLVLSEYTQQDADFTGYEIEVGARFALPRGELEVTLGRDEVDAEFTDGRAVPRIVPARNLLTARYTLDDFSAKLLVKDVERQTNVAMGETMTEGFTLVNADASWSYGLSESTRLTLTAFARNLTDEVSRNHASFVKDQVPLPGRNIGVRVRLAF